MTLLGSGLFCASPAPRVSETRATAAIAVAIVPVLAKLFMAISFGSFWLSGECRYRQPLDRVKPKRLIAMTSVVSQPFNGANLLQKRQIDVLVPDQLVERIFDLVVLVVLGRAQLQTMSDAVLRQVDGTLLAINRQKHGVADKIAADGNAQQVEIALGDMRADRGEIKLL